MSASIAERVHNLQARLGADTVAVTPDTIYQFRNGGPTVSISERLVFEDGSRSYEKVTKLSATQNEQGQLIEPSVTVEFTNTPFKPTSTPQIDVVGRMNSILGEIERIANQQNSNPQAA